MSNEECTPVVRKDDRLDYDWRVEHFDENGDLDEVTLFPVLDDPAKSRDLAIGYALWKYGSCEVRAD